MSDPPAEEFHQPDPPIAVAAVEEESVLQSCADADSLMLKKTRDLPNLAECHSCGFRINTSDGKDRLRSLHSEWRIVLLCRRCYKRCARGAMCTYCLGEVSGEEERFNCCKCSCCIHKDCVLKFGQFPPWSYFDWRSSNVCVDCWLPRKVKKLRDVKLGNRMIGNYLGSGRRLMEGGGNDVDYSVEKRSQMVSKPNMAFKAREKSVCRALVGKENGGISYGHGGGLGEKRRGVDDAELAFQLHRVMNSSPRISRNFGPASSSHVNVKKSRVGKYMSSGNISAFKQRPFIGGPNFNASFNNGCNPKDDNDVYETLKEGQGSSNNSMDSEPLLWKELNLPKPQVKFTYARRKNSPDGRPSQYLFKYSRKKLRLKQSIARKYTYLYDRNSYENETSSAAIVLHSSNETRKFPDSCILALPACMCGSAPSRNKT